MAEMFQFIPENERPYEWAKAEMETYFKNPEIISTYPYSIKTITA